MSGDAQTLRWADLLADPHGQFLIWFAAAGEAGIATPEAMALATATPDGRPSVRMVLLKSADERGYAFFTNRESRKGGELGVNPRAALLFHWDSEAMNRQVRIEGSLEHLPDEESDRYFATRPLMSRIGAIASPQSRPIPSRDWLEQKAAEVKAAAGPDLERPAHWGGFLLRPAAYQFWQHGEDRLHDVFRYLPEEDGAWRLERLGP